MKVATTVLQTLVRLSGLILIVLGGLFWTGHAISLIPLHMLIGLILVLALWGLAAVAATVRVPLGLVLAAVAWGLLVPIVGLTQDGILPGNAHWVIQVAHLLIGLTAIAFGERLAAQIKRTKPPDPASPATG
jgi:hypothetical protein